MLNTRENIRIINFDSIILLSILFFGLLIYNNPVRNSTKLNRNPVSTFMSVSENSAVSSTCIRLQIFQKTWISNKDNFNLLAFNRNPLSENKKTGIKISQLQNLRRNSYRIPLFIFRYHLFPVEMDEPPLLS
ncbi:MAG: hypothetical protein ABSF81_04205 [Bacteroidales bacterium]